ncbi:site-specific DNA-methyltransferase, partial [archaeon]|nr:site-specific DNA-methyltransferase [archaeon]
KLKDYIELEKNINSRKNLEDVEEDIYDRILTFFSRYYLDGDFISKGIYSNANKYSIPYNGDEVYLHWANKDQYYVKTTEDFKDFKFVENGYEIHFKIKEADVEQNNNKSDEKKLFIYLNHELKGKKLVFYFDYRGINDSELAELKELTGFKKADKKSVLDYNFIKMRNDLGIDQSSLSELDFLNQKYKNQITLIESESCILKWNLNKYISKNSSDYFIHKDLKGFLLRELDFYIKNEMFNIDKVNDEDEIKFNLKKIKTFKEISSNIVEFLAQIENFQLKLCEKKKFVVSTDYCITLDHIDEKFYAEILKNEKQLEEWKKLGFIDGSIDVKYLKEHPTLVLDTKFFSGLKYQILSEIENLEENTNGVLINSENFQALNLMLEKYRGKIKCCYIDPPYNTGNDGFLYKDGFSHSSWMSLMNDRLIIMNKFLSDEGVTFVSIDDNESENLKKIMEHIFGEIIANYYIQVRYEGKTLNEKSDYQKLIEQTISCQKNKFRPNKEFEEYSLDKFEWEIVEKNNNPKIVNLGGRNVKIFIKGDYEIKKVKSNLNVLKETWASGSVLTGNASGKYFDNYISKRVSIDGLETLYKVEGIGEDGLGYRYFTGPKKEGATRGKFYSGVPLSRREVIEKGEISKKVKLISNFYNFADSFGNCRHEGNVGLRSGKKPEKFLEKFIQLSTNETDTVLDFFVGSGTTCAVAHKKNRKYIAVEMGEYFDTKTLIRMKHVLFGEQTGISKDVNWKGGGIFKYQTLEQYEDTLNNISFEDPNQLALTRSDYKIKYMLDLESRNNNVFMNLEHLESPFGYKLNIDGKETNVDLIETFNYVAGIYVSKIEQLESKKQKYIIVKGKIKNKKVIVIWRNAKEIDRKEDKNFIESQVTDEGEIFVNSDCLVKNATPLDIIFKEKLFGGI